MDEDWRKAFRILMCAEIGDGAGTGICHGAPSTCSSMCYMASDHFVWLPRQSVSIAYRWESQHDIEIQSNLC